MNRRDFIRGSAAVIPATVAVQALATRWVWAQPSDFKSDEDVLNYALTLEFLESAFYKEGNGSGVLSGEEASLLGKVGADEDAHVTALSDTIRKIGGKPVSAPRVEFGDAFKSRDSFLKLSHTFENTGVQAYLGAAAFIKDKAILQAAAGIFGVECRHAAVVGDLLGLKAEGGVFMGSAETPKSKDEVLKAVMPFIG